ncbi:MAG: DUF1849 family protein [Rhodospirillales bacterium]|nr:DUF1849 family protein [Rhodospirillales bacterium]MBO6785827.1 DUF1849 family protein [Rhodospirillales bacterium]
MSSLKSRFAAVLVAASVCGLANAGARAEMVPHQAIYNMSLASSSPASRFNGVSGAAVTHIEKTCEGWLVNEQIVMTMLTVAGGAIEREMNFKARESLDGDVYFFESNSVTNGEHREYSGSARRKKNGDAEAEFVTPRPFEMPLPKGTRFYVSTTNWLLDMLESGARAGETYAFDGTDDEGPQKVTAFILPDKIGGDGLSGDETLLAAKAWQIRMAFFKIEGQASQPEFELSLRMLENGIITHFELIFDDLVVDQILQDVLPAKNERCS